MGQRVRLYNLPPLSPRPKEWRSNPVRQAEWLWSVLDYLAHEQWTSNEAAREWLSNELRGLNIETNRAPYPPPFDLPGLATDSRGRNDQSKCRQKWWARRKDHKEWVKNQIHWLTCLVQCIGSAMEIDTDWQARLKGMLDTYLKTECGCEPHTKVIVRPLRSGASLGLYG